MPAALDDALADGLAITDRRLTAFEHDAVAIAETFGRDAQMHLALAPQYDFVRFRIVHDDDRRIFLGQLVERLAELDVVLALLARDRDREHRRIWLDLGNRPVRVLACAQRVA